MFNIHDISRNEFQLVKGQAKKGYDWWWHSFTAYSKKTGKPRPFFIEFFLINPKFGQNEPILGQLKANKDAKKVPSYGLVKVGCWGEDGVQLHRFFGWNELKIHKSKPFSIEAGDCYCDETITKGCVSISEEDAKSHPEWMCDSGSISWNLKIDKQIAFNVGYGAGRVLRTFQWFEMFWHAEGMKSAFEGTISYNGEDYEVRRADCYGYADKNWGKDFTSPWIWLSSNDIVSNTTGKRLTDSVFDIGGGRPKILCVPLKGKLLSAFYHEGKEFEFNFSKFWTFTRTAFRCEETKDEILWHIEQKTWTCKMVVDIRCKKKDMILVNYEAPNGKKRHNRLWNGGNGEGNIKLYYKGALYDDMHVGHVGCEYGEYDAIPYRRD